MATVAINLTCDLQHPVKVQYIDGNMFSLDNGGNVVNVDIYDNGEAATVGGNVSANIVRADGTTVAVSGTLSGNRASVVLSQTAYAVPGVASVVVKLTSGSTVTTIAAFVANVYQTSTDAIVDPGTIIPSVQALIAEIEAAVATIPADYSALWTTIAPAFSATTSYNIGQYVTYNGGLYRFKNAHPAGTWNANHVVRVSVGTDIVEMGVRTYRVIVASSQSALDGQGDYADLDTMPPNTIVAYYLTNAILPHCPPINYTNARATVVCYSSNNTMSNRTGRTQVWVDAYDGKIWYRVCWEGSQTWSQWYGNGAEQNDILFPYKLTKASAYKATRTNANQGDIITVCGIYATTGGNYQTAPEQNFVVTGVSNGSEEFIAQYCTFTGEPFSVKATKNYTSLKIALSGAYIEALGDNDFAIVGLAVHNSQNYMSTAELYGKTNENAGVLKRHKSTNLNICRMHGMSAKAGDVLTVRPAYTNTTATGMYVFGMYGNAQSDGYDELGNVNIGEVAQFTCQRDYANFQTWFAVPTTFSGDTLEVAVDAAVNLKPGVQNDIIQLQKRPILNAKTCNIFHRVVCIGDSYTSGHIQTPTDPSATGTNEMYAYPQFLAQLTGNEYINCGISGATCISWQVGARGLPKAQSVGRVQAYIIGLAINDSGTVSGGGRRVPVGTVDDIGTDAQTYYAQMAKIVREVNAISPLAKIFINTCPQNEPERYDPYNQAIRDIVAAYATTYPVHCIDLAANYSELYKAASLSGDYTHAHYTAMGYEQFAEIYAYVLSDYINTHISAFQDVYKIPYDT